MSRGDTDEKYIRGLGELSMAPIEDTSNFSPCVRGVVQPEETITAAENSSAGCMLSFQAKLPRGKNAMLLRREVYQVGYM